MSRYPISRIEPSALSPLVTCPLRSWGDIPPPLRPQGAEVWLMTARYLEPYRSELERSLSDEERARCERFVRREDRERARLFRGALRRILAAYLDADPIELQFSTSENGKPALANDALAFNLSHSGDWLAVACAREGDMGVDIEVRGRDLNPLDVANHSFCKSEAARLAELPLPDQLPLFMKWWTAKEATLKAWGETLFSGVGSLDFSGWIAEPSIAFATADATRWHAWRFERRDVWGTIVTNHAIQRVTLRLAE
ncbi:MAG: 4'-phosphopantetheinyl transferase superfamily protein [Kiritimatiellae bacterium]|nr:4'-phosphopantetheinyl transferase superfamily protein [Kiritimatiellia bacterium]